MEEEEKALAAEEGTFEEEGEGEVAALPDGKEIGRRGENAAVRFLKQRGYEILERNWECPAGEADIIARDDEGTLVFCEVKTRTNLEKGLPQEAVDAEKRARYEKIAAWYLRDHDYCDIPLRFDIIALLVVKEDRAMVRHFVNAFSEAS